VIYVLVAIGGVCILFAAVLLELVLHGLAGPLGIDLIDRFGGGTAYAGFAAAVLVLGVLPAWLASYLQSSGDLRLKLQANLAARPPQQPGFPSTCRQCGAALDVAPGQLGVRCAYCGSDNLVALPAAWVERAGTRQRHFHQSIVEAAAKAAALRSEARGDLKSLGIIGGVLIVIMAGVGHFAMWLDEDDVPITYSASMGPPRVLYNWSDSTTLPENTPGDLHRAMHIALRDGEVFELTTSEPCPKLTVYNTTSFPLFQREDAVPFGIAADGSRVARYIAPYTGLFERQREALLAAARCRESPAGDLGDDAVTERVGHAGRGTVLGLAPGVHGERDDDAAMAAAVLEVARVATPDAGRVAAADLRQHELGRQLGSRERRLRRGRRRMVRARGEQHDREGRPHARTFARGGAEVKMG
jgi:hypothetical protein